MILVYYSGFEFKKSIQIILEKVTDEVILIFGIFGWNEP